MVPLDFSGPMVRYVPLPIEETVILMCSVIVNHMKRISNTNDRLVDLIVFYPPKNLKFQPVPPPMPLEALLVPDYLTDSDSDGIGGGTVCNFIYFFPPCLLPPDRIRLRGRTWPKSIKIYYR